MKATIQLEYAASHDDVAGRARSMTINLFPLPKETRAQIEITQKLERNLLTAFQKEKIIDQALLQTNDGFPRMLVEHGVGGRIQKGHEAGVFLKLMPATAQFIQIQAVESRSTRMTRRICGRSRLAQDSSGEGGSSTTMARGG